MGNGILQENEMQNLKVAYILPNLTLRSPIETTAVALVPAGDSRVVAEAQSNLALRKLMEGFFDEKGRRQEVSVLLYDRSAFSKNVANEAIVSFRNAFALSCVLAAVANSIGNPNILGTIFSDYFDFYPFTPSVDGKSLTGLTASRNAVDTPDGFHSCISPVIAKMGMTIRAEPDKQLWADLLKFWNRRFIQERKDWDSNKVFRSLAVAYNAAAVPHKNSLWLHDFGIHISLWVSSFEILTHPRKGKANLGTVLNLLNETKFSTPNLKRKRVVRYAGSSITTHYAGYLYNKIYGVRNDFFHGNPVTFQRLVHKTDKSEILLNKIVPLVYAEALSAFVNPTRKSPIPQNVPVKKVIRRLRKWGFRYDLYESALERVLTGKGIFDLG